MFDLFHKKPAGEMLVITLDGMHCASCSLTIDDTVEELEGVIKSQTSYARSQSKVAYDPQKITADSILAAIEKLGYTATSAKK